MGKSVVKIYPNPLKIALQYKEMLDLGQAESQADLARILGVSRAKVTQMIREHARPKREPVDQSGVDTQSL